MLCLYLGQLAGFLDCSHVVVNLTHRSGHDAEEQEKLKRVAHNQARIGSIHAGVQYGEQAAGQHQQ